MLGNTIEEIAFEKGGIIKPNTPVIIGETAHQLYPIFETLATKNASEIYYSTEVKNDTDFQSPLLGEYQNENKRTVLKACELLKEKQFTISNNSIQLGLDHLSANTGFFGRLHVVKSVPLTIFDVSHNPAGISASLETIGKINKGKLHIIYGTSADKDVFSILQLFPKNAHYYFTEFINDRSIKIEALKINAEQIWTTNCDFFTSPKEALTKAQQQANHEDTIIAIGSFFLISDIF
jgi:dihydrofolate synthase/folylpolyglutamate synthase